MTEPWRPHVTVAAVVAYGERFLMVEEWVDGALRLNQPAGHLEPGEDLIAAACREAWEETGYRIEPTAVLGVYCWPHPAGHATFLRTTFAAGLRGRGPERTPDPDIHQVRWLTATEIKAAHERLRSPMVLRAVTDYQSGCRYPLALLGAFG